MSGLGSAIAEYCAIRMFVFVLLLSGTAFLGGLLVGWIMWA